ncbi:FAD-dependent oxidoreductase [Austwickia chelonae]|uniref:FAD-dependent oxidoreductase n=1 Tax=Austwickia chelonae TaxID=100225 RepID=UPI00059026FE|nr:FAD-dependent oxidoreductase [Austwickia chelonae]
MQVDILVIGWGKAGKTLAARLAASGRSVVLVERSPQMYGGTCINVGCVPTKDLIVSAETRRDSDDPATYFAEAVAGRNALVGALNRANHALLASSSSVTVLDGNARFVGPKRVVVERNGDEVTVEAGTVVIGTGAVPRTIEVPGSKGPRIFDSSTIQQVDPMPERLVVVGGGFIGLEFANMFAHFGSSVTVLDAGAEFLPRVDRDVAVEVRATLTDRGVDIRQGLQIEEFRDLGDSVEVRAGDACFEADAVLVATGRAPATVGLGLETAGIDTDERGYVLVDDQLRTTAEGVFAVGDVNGGPQFTYISFDDFRIVWDALAGSGERRRSDRRAVPSSTFISPPLSQVGMTEQEARESGRTVVVAKKKVASIAAMPRPKILGETHGLIKFLIDADEHTVLGATLFCTDSQELINMVALAIRLGATVEDLRDGIWTHPSSTEAFNEVLATTAPLI